MKRRIIKINSELCNGCASCVTACHEGAIKMKDGRAYLSREDYCDGLGDCLPACPTGAITFDVREALAYDEAAVNEAKREMADSKSPFIGGCPGVRAQTVKSGAADGDSESQKVPSRLVQWPCQIKLMPTRAPYYDGANLLIAADCTAFAYGNFHNDFIKKHITVIGCPKLDGINYADKLTEIISQNDIRGVKIVRMEVPCCGGLEAAAKKALSDSGKFIPWQVVVISTDGKILE